MHRTFSADNYGQEVKHLLLVKAAGPRPEPPERFYQVNSEFARVARWKRDIRCINALAEREISVSYETIQAWCQKFGPRYAKRLRRRHPGFGFFCRRSLRQNRRSPKFSLTSHRPRWCSARRLPHRKSGRSHDAWWRCVFDPGCGDCTITVDHGRARLVRERSQLGVGARKDGCAH